MNDVKVLAVDIDGVVLDHPKGMREWAAANGIVVGCTADELYCYSMSPMFPGMSDEAVMELLVEFSKHDDFAQLPLIAGFTEAIQTLKGEFPDLKLTAITAPGADEKTRSNRLKNIESFGFDEIHILELGASKALHLSRLPKGSVYVDDLLSHVHVAESFGLNAYLFRQPHNADIWHHKVLPDWETGVDVVRRSLRGLPLQELAEY